MIKRSIYVIVQDSAQTFGSRPLYWIRQKQSETSARTGTRKIKTPPSFQAISFHNWREDMERFSAFLLYKLKISHQEKIAFLCDNRYEWSLICLGINCIGAIDVPRGCDSTPDELKYILTHTETKTIIVENEKIFQKISSLLPLLPAVKNIISVEPKEKYTNPPTEKELKGARFYSLIDTFLEGESLLQKNGDKLLSERGEAIEPEDIVSIIYTSGTTGNPKGVVLLHQNFCWSVNQLQTALPVYETDRCVIFLPPWHIAERTLELVLIASGASMAPSQITTLTDDFAAIKPTLLLSVPRVWEQLYNKIFDSVRKAPKIRQTLFRFACYSAQLSMDASDTILNRFAMYKNEDTRELLLRKMISLFTLPFAWIAKISTFFVLKKIRSILGGKIRFAISGAGAMPEHASLFFRSCGVPILDGYGMTETTALGAISELPWPLRNAVGKPSLGVQVQLRDSQGKAITKPGIKGVLFHKGPHVMKEYYKEKKKTEEILQDNWLNSGDIFMWSLTNDLIFTGRAKDTIVLSGGENIEPTPIENRLKAHHLIEHVVIVGQDRKSLCALLTPKKDLLLEVCEKQGGSLPEDESSWDKNRRIRSIFQKIIKEEISAKNGFNTFEKITNFSLTLKLEVGKELTNTMKIKRNVVLDKYQDIIHQMYAKST